MDSILFITRITEPYSVLYLYLSSPVLAAYLLAARIRCPLNMSAYPPTPNETEVEAYYLRNKNGAGMNKHARPPSKEFPPPIPNLLNSAWANRGNPLYNQSPPSDPYRTKQRTRRTLRTMIWTSRWEWIQNLVPRGMNRTSRQRSFGTGWMLRYLSVSTHPLQARGDIPKKEVKKMGTNQCTSG